MLIRALRCLVVVLAVVYGLCTVAVIADHFPVSGSTKVSAREGGETELANPISWALSRLPLSPIFNRKVSAIAIVVENQEHARPYQEGLDRALMVEEWVVEGYITRFVVIFDRGNLPDMVGPVRSIRPYFIHGLLPWPTLLLHAGGSPEAFDAVGGTDVIVNTNALTGTYGPYFDRIEGIPAPHDLFITKENILAIAKEFSIPALRWPPYETGMAAEGAGVTVIDVNFHSPLHNVQYAYDQRTQSYARTNGEVEDQAAPKNVLFLEMPVTGVGEVGRLTIPVEGEGPLLLFRNGIVVRGLWHKADDRTAFTFTDDEGTSLSFAQGQTWMTVIPSLDRVTWQNDEKAVESAD
jgi:hypothetical protein